MTKCGRYGLASFDYSPATIRTSVNRSLERLQTTYLDTVYLHDVEFVCSPIFPKATGNHTEALQNGKAYGLNQEDERRVWGAGDEQILAGIMELRKMKEEGLVRTIGISGEYYIASVSPV
jgi:D-arabinose 1-dehydrogenase